MAPALLAGLVVVELERLAGPAPLAGVAAAGAAWRLRAPMLLAVMVGAAVAASLRQL